MAVVEWICIVDIRSGAMGFLKQVLLVAKALPSKLSDGAGVKPKASASSDWI
jgi:hypothetical protein